MPVWPKAGPKFFREQFRRARAVFIGVHPRVEQRKNSAIRSQCETAPVPSEQVVLMDRRQMKNFISASVRDSGR